jgi:hypothetical protein
VPRDTRINVRALRWCGLVSSVPPMSTGRPWYAVKGCDQLDRYFGSCSFSRGRYRPGDYQDEAFRLRTSRTF